MDGVTTMPAPSAITRDKDDVALRLLKGAAKKSYEPVVDIDWEAPLADDKFFFPSYNAAITVRDEVLSAHPGIREAVEAVTDTLDTPTQIRLNGRSDIDGVPPETVAEEYLKEIGAL